MIEVKGNIWHYPANIIGITTNGSVKKDGTLVMGRGIALEAKQRWPEIPRILGSTIQIVGNVPYMWHYHGTEFPFLRAFFSFPVKHRWQEQASIPLIKLSAIWLECMASYLPDQTFVLGRPGCGNGGLTWSQVKPLLTDLPDNVHIITKE